MKNPFDSIQEPEVNVKNPGFYCVNFIEHNGHLLSRCNCPPTCEKQCDECINKIIEHHAKKKQP